jgi:hypothetical protein
METAKELLKALSWKFPWRVPQKGRTQTPQGPETTTCTNTNVNMEELTTYTTPWLHMEKYNI